MFYETFHFVSPPSSKPAWTHSACSQFGGSIASIGVCGLCPLCGVAYSYPVLQPVSVQWTELGNWSDRDRKHVCLVKCFFSQVKPLMWFLILWLHRLMLEPCRGWHAGQELTAGRKDGTTAHTSTAAKAKPVEPQRGLLVINTTSPTTSSLLFDPFHRPQGDHDLHFEKHS